MQIFTVGREVNSTIVYMNVVTQRVAKRCTLMVEKMQDSEAYARGACFKQIDQWLIYFRIL